MVSVKLGEAFVSIRASLAQLDKDLKKVAPRVQRTLSKVSAATDKWGRELTTKVSLPLAALGGLALKTFADFEKGLIGVGKTTGIEGEELQQLGKRIQEIGQDVPDTIDRLLEIAQVAGAMGIKGSDDIAKFTETVSKLGGATDLAGESAAFMLSRILKVTGTSVGEVDRLGSALVQLGNDFTTTESQIAEVSTRVAQATAPFNTTAADVAGIGAALASVGVEAQAGGSTIGVAFQAIDKAARGSADELEAFARITGQSIEEAARSLGESADVADFEAFVNGLGRITEEGGSVAQALEDIGIGGRRSNAIFGTLAKRSEILTEGLRTSRSAYEENTALTEEHQRAMESLSAQFSTTKNAVMQALTAIGAALAPSAEKILEVVSTISIAIAELPPGVLEAAGKIGAALGVGGPILLAISVLSKVMTGLIAATGPVGLFIAALATIATLVITNWDSIKAATKALGEFLKSQFMFMKETIVGVWNKLTEIISAPFVNGFAKIREIVTSAYEWLVGGSIIPDLVTDIESVLSGLKDILMLPFKLGFEAAQLLAENFSVDFPGILTSIKDKIGETLSGLKDKLLQPFKDGFNAIKSVAVDGYNTLVGQSIIPDLVNRIGEEFSRLPGLIVPPVKDSIGGVEDSFSGLSDRMGDFGKTISDELKGVLDGTKSWADAMQSVLDKVLDQITQPAFSALGGALSGIFSSALGGSVAPATSPIPPIRPFQTGGIVRGPTLGMVGEKDDEAILPLENVGGRLGVAASDVGGSNVQVNVYAPPGSDVREERSEGPDGEQVDIFIDQAVGRNIRPGTQTFRSIQAAFGLNQQTRRR